MIGGIAHLAGRVAFATGLGNSAHSAGHALVRGANQQQARQQAKARKARQAKRMMVGGH